MAQRKSSEVSLDFFTDLELGKVFARMEDEDESILKISLKFRVPKTYVKRCIDEWRKERALWHRK